MVSHGNTAAPQTAHEGIAVSVGVWLTDCDRCWVCGKLLCNTISKVQKFRGISLDLPSKSIICVKKSAPLYISCTSKSDPAGWKVALRLNHRAWLFVSCRHTLLGNRDVDNVFFPNLLFSILSHVWQPVLTPGECAKQAAPPQAAGVRTGQEPWPPVIL